MDPEVKTLEDEGWTRQTVASEPRLTELADLYRELGLEVKIVDFAALGIESGSCIACFEAESGTCRHKVIYTRGGTAQGADR